MQLNAIYIVVSTTAAEDENRSSGLWERREPLMESRQVNSNLRQGHTFTIFVVIGSGWVKRGNAIVNCSFEIH